MEEPKMQDFPILPKSHLHSYLIQAQTFYSLVSDVCNMVTQFLVFPEIK